MWLFRKTLPLTAALSFCCSGFAQQSTSTLEEIQVLGDRLDYSLANAPSPTLIYGRNHFESFEPQSVGDMLKRISGVGFSGDLGEFEAPQLRGLGAQYTQVLINGNRVAGNNSDRSVLVDRIPAELIERIELIRSPTPDLDSQGVGGTLNLILKDPDSMQGLAWRFGGLYYPDSDPTAKGTAAATIGGRQEAWSYLLAANRQERRNSKDKQERLFDNDGTMLQVANQHDVRDSLDQGVRGSFTYELGSQGTIDVRLALLENRIDEDELIVSRDADLQTGESRLEKTRIAQDRFELDTLLDRSLSSTASLQLNFSASRFDEDASERELLLEGGSRLPELDQTIAAQGRVLQIGATYSNQLTATHLLKIGTGASREKRDVRQRLLELDEDQLLDTTPGNGSYRVQETRMHAYLMDVWNVSQALTLEYGLRLENTQLVQRGNDGRTNESQIEFNPSAHLLYQTEGAGQFRASVARTLRRPGFDEIVPFINRDTPDEDQITVGNPELQPESAWGLDLGYTQRFASSRSNLGINLFYRNIDDKVELSQIGEELYTPRNIGNGSTWGLELDFAIPFTFSNGHELALSGNYVWIDSKIRDPFSREYRPFNLQPRYITNIDLFHSLPGPGFSHGLSWQNQGTLREFQTDETTTVRYEPNLEYYIEQRVGRNFTVRLTVNNILNARKRERGLLFGSWSGLQAGVVDQLITDREQSGTVFLLSVRGSF